MPEEKSIDLRVQKTERALLGALDTLLRERPFEAITVSDLCDAAMVRRQTFYRHFGDKYQFLGHCMRKWESLLAPDGGEACRRDPIEGFAMALREMLRYLKENPAIMTGMLGCLPGTGGPAFIAEPITFAIREKARLLAAAGIELPAPPEIVAAFLSGAMMGVAKWWGTSGASLPEAEVIESVRSILCCVLSPTNPSPQKEGTNDER